jgi:ethanolaminephosphotransferase
MAAMCLVVPHILTVVIYGRAFEGPIDSWAVYLVAITQFSYFTLDNVDGKQARRTGSSSPLGQMFDHGCDAITFNLCILT